MVYGAESVQAIGGSIAFPIQMIMAFGIVLGQGLFYNFARLVHASMKAKEYLEIFFP